jgi:hypothetical protein
MAVVRAVAMLRGPTLFKLLMVKLPDAKGVP